jgi:hypothetical protein
VTLWNISAAEATSESVDATQIINVTARVGDADGANLPWFPIADSILLFWWIHRENATIPLKLKWVTQEESGLQRLELWSAVRRVQFGEPLLAIEKEPNNTSNITALAPAKPRSSSPSLTYPLRIAIIYVLAPTAIFINNLFGDGLASVFKTTLVLLFYLLVMLGWLLLAIVVTIFLRLCLGRRSLGISERIQNRLQRVNQNSERLLQITTIQRWSDQRRNDERISGTVNPSQAKYNLGTLEDKNIKTKADIEKGTLNK